MKVRFLPEVQKSEREAERERRLLFLFYFALALFLTLYSLLFSDPSTCAKWGLHRSLRCSPSGSAYRRLGMMQSAKPYMWGCIVASMGIS
jgi:hypothetical protein